MLTGKKILFISPRFFSYETEIKNELENMGGEVCFFDERPSNSSFQKALIRVSKLFLYRKIVRYYRSILELVKEKKFNYVFVIKGEATPPFFLKELKKKLPECIFLYYSYDALANNKNASKILHFFDSKFTFDENDTHIIKELKFRPLFFLDSYVPKEKLDIQYELSFIGTAHSDRYNFVKKVLAQLSQSSSANKSTYTFFYCQSKWYYLLRRIVDSDFKKVKMNDLSFTPMTKNSVIDVFRKSKCIIDIQHPSQKGLTMRTIEALGAKKKIITTNESINKYDFYSKTNILIVDRVNPQLDIEFLSCSYEEIAPDIYKKYSLQSWIEEIFLTRH